VIQDQKNSVYYLPGRGGTLRTGLGIGLGKRGCLVWGREIRDGFARLEFDEQVELIAGDIAQSLWHESNRIIANSYGGYLLLNALMRLPPYIGRILLLSPVIGAFSAESQKLTFVPPRAGAIQRQIESGAYPAPLNCQVHVGSEDWQSDPVAINRFGEQLAISVTIVNGRGHMLGQDYVGDVLNEWL
jgi:alpha-beta hydrolase superfamily lysophospholipase